MENKRKFPLNWVDLVIVLLVVGLVAAAYLKFNVTGKDTLTEDGGEDPIHYTIFISGIRPTTAEQLLVGDTVYNSNDGVDLGTIASVEITDTMSTIALPNGTVEEFPLEGYVDILIHIDATGTISEKGCLVNGNYQLNVGSYRGLQTKYVTCNGTIVSFEG